MYISDNGVQIKVEADRSDLWIKVTTANARDEAIANNLKKVIDTGMMSLPRTVYKYVRVDGCLFAYTVKNNEWSGELYGYVGLDAGSISINTAVVDEFGTVLEVDYTFTEGDVINNVKKSLANLYEKMPHNIRIKGAGAAAA